ncbi:MAG: FixH family protein [Chloroflexota bacterium]|nr:FixH family protein [Chloroflexota bacterium]
MLLTRRQVIHVVGAGAVLSLFEACQAPAASPGSAPAGVAPAANPLLKPRATAELTAVQATSELAVGRNRFALGLIDARSQPITSGNVTVEFFKLIGGGKAEKRADTPAVFRSVGGASKGVWVTSATFSETGQWGAQVTLDAGDGPKQTQMNFEVGPKFSAPGYADPVPRSASLTDRDVNGDTSHICSNTPACALHSMSIAEALEPGQKPLVLLFATPALCTSATCAPELEAVQQLHSVYAESANFVHVEIYQYPFDGQQHVQTVDEWHLPSEPWTFIIDKAGSVGDRFEGSAPMEELEPALKAVLT